MLDRLPELFVWGYASELHLSFGWFQLFQALLCGAVVLVPTILMGVLFPLIAGLCAPPQERLGSHLGRALAANALGTSTGAPIAVAVLLPALGIRNSIVAVALLHLAIAALYLHTRRRAEELVQAPYPPSLSHLQRLAPLLVLGSFGALAAFARWDAELMTACSAVATGALAGRGP